MTQRRRKSIRIEGRRRVEEEEREIRNIRIEVEMEQETWGEGGV